MSAIEIPKDGREGWLAIREYSKGAFYNTDMDKAANLAVYLLAGWMRSEFKVDHGMQFQGRCVGCLILGDDRRHAWLTVEDWIPAARKVLEGR